MESGPIALPASITYKREAPTLYEIIVKGSEVRSGEELQLYLHTFKVAVKSEKSIFEEFTVEKRCNVLHVLLDLALFYPIAVNRDAVLAKEISFEFASLLYKQLVPLIPVTGDDGLKTIFSKTRENGPTLIEQARLSEDPRIVKLIDALCMYAGAQPPMPLRLVKRHFSELLQARLLPQDEHPAVTNSIIADYIDEYPSCLLPPIEGDPTSGSYLCYISFQGAPENIENQEALLALLLKKAVRYLTDEKIDALLSFMPQQSWMLLYQVLNSDICLRKSGLYDIFSNHPRALRKNLNFFPNPGNTCLRTAFSKTNQENLAIVTQWLRQDLKTLELNLTSTDAIGFTIFHHLLQRGIAEKIQLLFELTSRLPTTAKEKIFTHVTITGSTLLNTATPHLCSIFAVISQLKDFPPILKYNLQREDSYGNNAITFLVKGNEFVKLRHTIDRLIFTLGAKKAKLRLEAAMRSLPIQEIERIINALERKEMLSLIRRYLPHRVTSLRASDHPVAASYTPGFAARPAASHRSPTVAAESFETFSAHRMNELLGQQIGGSNPGKFRKR